MTISGSVTNSRNDKPVGEARVVVTVGDAEIGSLFSRDDGTFTMTRSGEFSGQTAKVVVEKQGYKTTEISYDISGADIELGKLELVPAGPELPKWIIPAAVAAGVIIVATVLLIIFWPRPAHPPSIGPAGGTFSNSVQVQLDPGREGDSVYFALLSAEEAAAWRRNQADLPGMKEYRGPFPLDRSATVLAAPKAENADPDSVATAEFRFRVADPEISEAPPAVSTETAGARIRVEVNGRGVSAEDFPRLVAAYHRRGQRAEVRAIAEKPGYEDSETVTKTISPPGLREVSFADAGRSRTISPTAYASQGISRIEAVPSGSYCSGAQPAILSEGTYNAPVSFLSTATPGDLGSCNAVRLRITFAQPVRRVVVHFSGSASAYTLEGYNRAGNRIATASQSADPYNYDRDFTVSLTGSQADITSVVFGRQTSLTIVRSIEFQE